MLVGEIAGYMASILASFTLVPQVIKTIRTRDSKALSASTLLLSFFCNICWFLNAMHYGNNALIFSAIVVNCLILPLLVIKYQNGELGDINTFKRYIASYFISLRTDP